MIVVISSLLKSSLLKVSSKGSSVVVTLTWSEQLSVVSLFQVAIFFNVISSVANTTSDEDLFVGFAVVGCVFQGLE